MVLSDADIHKIAHLARLTLSSSEVTQLTGQLGSILDFIDQINAANTDQVAAIAHALDLPQRLREDRITETDQRAAFQAIAPAVEAGLYLVPKVLDTESA